MKVIFTDTTNHSAKEILGRECELNYDLKAYFTFDPEGLDFELRQGRWTTSLILKIEIIEKTRYFYHIVIKTLNSTYTFAYGTKSEDKPLTDGELHAMAMLLF